MSPSQTASCKLGGINNVLSRRSRKRACPCTWNSRTVGWCYSVSGEQVGGFLSTIHGCHASIASFQVREKGHLIETGSRAVGWPVGRLSRVDQQNSQERTLDSSMRREKGAAAREQRDRSYRAAGPRQEPGVHDRPLLGIGDRHLRYRNSKSCPIGHIREKPPHVSRPLRQPEATQGGRTESARQHSERRPWHVGTTARGDGGCPYGHRASLVETLGSCGTSTHARLPTC